MPDLLLLVFLDKGFKFQPYASTGCHNVLIMPMNLSDIAILKIHSVGYCCIITRINKCEALSLLQKSDLNAKSRTS